MSKRSLNDAVFETFQMRTAKFRQLISDSEMRTNKLPLFVTIHGGFGWGGEADSSLTFPFVSALVLAGTVAVASIEYRLYAFGWDGRAQIEDATAALAFFAEHADEYGIDPKRVILHGNSVSGKVFV